MGKESPPEPSLQEHAPEEAPQRDGNEEVFHNQSQSKIDEEEQVEDDPFFAIEYDVEAWDDTALIEAYERAVKSYRGDKDTKNNKDVKAQSKQDSCKAGATSDIMVGAPEPSRKRKASNPTPQAAAPHVRVSKRSKRSIDHRQLPHQQIRTGGEHAEFEADTNRKMKIPPPPPPVLYGEPLSEELEQLLKSWYEAGYRAGLYVGRQSRDQ
ncbi:unnamed protein product [Agarophyton chilense]